MTDEELEIRRHNLLDNNRLHNAIVDMFKQKHVDWAELDSTTAISGHYGNEEIIVIHLFIADLKNNFGSVYLYISEDVFDENKFEKIDDQLPVRLSLKARIVLRILLLVAKICKLVHNDQLSNVSINKLIFANVYSDGTYQMHN